jgi:hypothetical protein
VYQDVQHDPEHRGRDEVFGRVDVAREPYDHVTGLALLVERERQPLDVVIQEVSQVVADSLADGRRHVFLRVGAYGPEYRDHDDRDRGGIRFEPRT